MSCTSLFQEGGITGEARLNTLRSASNSDNRILHLQRIQKCSIAVQHTDTLAHLTWAMAGLAPTGALQVAHNIDRRITFSIGPGPLLKWTGDRINFHAFKLQRHRGSRTTWNDEESMENEVTRFSARKNTAELLGFICKQ